MKITAKQFAISLYESLEGKTSGQVKLVIEEFVKLLAKKNQLGAAEKIVSEFVKTWNNRRGIVEAGVVSANSLDKANLKLLKDYIIKISGAKEVLISEKIDKGILGGVIIRYGDKILDGSLKTQLVDLRARLVK